MSVPAEQGDAGDADYGVIGPVYADYRRQDPRIAELIEVSLGPAHTVVNIGAGAGSYEPIDRAVTAVEPSASMRALRPAHLVPAIGATAEDLPFADNAFDAAMTTFSVHHWKDLHAGLTEMRRVARGPLVLLTCDPTRLRHFWLFEYAPEVIEAESRRYPEISTIADLLGGRSEVITVPIPADCRDGFNEAYFARPQLLLDPAARRACSAWSFVDTAVQRRFEDHLRHDLASGEWDARHGYLRALPSFAGSVVLVVSVPTP